MANRLTVKFTVKVICTPSPDSQERLERITRLLLAKYVKDKDTPPHEEREAGSNKGNPATKE